MTPHPTTPTLWPQPVRWRLFRWLQGHAPTPRSPARRDDGLDALIDLDARTLSDIGAPERLLSRAHAHREAQRRCRDDLRAGASTAGWRHW